MIEQITTPETPTPVKNRTSPLLIVLAIVVLAAVLFSAVLNFRTSQSVQTILKESGLSNGETREDDVSIMGEYWIRSTLPISDAYKSGDDSRLDDRQKETLDMASAVLDEIITQDMTPYDKEKAVYDWMTTKLKYDTGVLRVIPQTQSDADNPYGVLKYHNAVCVGYATTFRLFMQMMDIDCMVVHNIEAYHSWDLVDLDGDWYHVDIYSDQGSGNYANFNMNDEMCARDHHWDRDFFPAAEGTQYNYAFQNAQPVEDIYTVPGLVKDALDQQEGAVFLSFDPIDEAHAQIVETMMNGVRNCVDETDEYILWMDWAWLHMTGNQYVLAVYIQGYADEDTSSYDISDEDQAKISEAIENAFGVSPDWEEVEETEYGMGEYAGATFA